MKRIPFILFAVLFFFTQNVFSQSDENETSLSVQLRPRAEYRNGSLTPRAEGGLPAGFINNRARLSLDFKRENLMMKVSGQHVGVWGQDPQIDTNGRFMLNEAWARLNFGTGFFAQLGRQSLVYDDERILGGLDWNMSGRFHDALKLGFEDKSNKLHLILAFNQNKESIGGGTYYDESIGQPYKSMQTLWYQYSDKSAPFNISALFINLGKEKGTPEDADTQYMQTMGTNINYSPNGFKLTGIFYYQTGKDISAWMAGVNAGYTLNPEWSFKVGSEYLSGDKTDDSKYQAFDPLYGTHHKFYGAMDYFYASKFKTGINPGLWDNFAGITFNPSKKVNLSLNYHYFSMAEDVYVNNEKLKKGLGSEFDFQIDWAIMKDVKLSAGYSTMFGTESMDVVKGGYHKSWQDWGWVSMNINPRILFVKW